MTDYAELRAALSDGSFDFDQRAYMNDVRALLDERDALRKALEVIKKWPVTSPLDMDAHNMAVVAQAALAQGEV